MNGRTAAAGVTSAVVPGALIIGTALIVQTIIGLQASRDQYRAEAARPRPTATVTSRPAPAGGNSTAPAPDVSRPPTYASGRTAVASADRPRGQNVIGAPRARPGGRGSPSPSPTSRSSCRGAVVAVRLPLALPRCALIVGGSR